MLIRCLTPVRLRKQRCLLERRGSLRKPNLSDILSFPRHCPLEYLLLHAKHGELGLFVLEVVEKVKSLILLSGL